MAAILFLDLTHLVLVLFSLKCFENIPLEKASYELKYEYFFGSVQNNCTFLTNKTKYVILRQ